MIKPLIIKKRMASILDLLGVSRMMHYLQIKAFFPFVRAINYHDIPIQESWLFEQQLRYYTRYFSSVNYEDLMDLHRGNWRKDKPGLIISFDDGFRSAYEVVAPLLEKYGFTGWFFIPSALIDIPFAAQTQKAAEHRVFPKSCQQNDQRVFLTWEEIVMLDKTHVIGSHTASHCRLKSTLTDQQLFDEVVASKSILEKKLKHQIKAFAWVGGEEISYSRQAAKMIRAANYQLAFLTNNSLIRPVTDLHLLDRTNLESDFPPGLVRFQLSGFLDLLYAPKRGRVASLIAP